MSVTQVARSADVLPPSRRRRWLRIVIAALSTLLAAGAFLQWGPIGLGNGPLEVFVPFGDGWIDQIQQPVGFILPMYNSGSSPAVVDSVQLIGGTRYPAPRILALAVVTSARCGGTWPAKDNGHGFVMVGCGGQNRGPLIGRSVGPTTQRNTWGFPAAAMAAAPPPGACWVLTKVVVHYHVGWRHYTATDWYQLSVCGPGGPHHQLEAAMNAAAGLG
jgi:4-amino-4-deoxy-L-arabinose transferase-like glycosyltransferase